MSEQQEYYERTAGDYDKLHIAESEHEISLALLLGLVKYYDFESILDVGAGTGRVIRHGKNQIPGVRIHGVEPVEGLREVAYAKGVTRDELTEGNALSLDYPDDHWDIVCAFGILHHIEDPEPAISEMCRVAKHGVFFSDLNNVGCGSFPQRAFVKCLKSVNLWNSFQRLKNGGKLEKSSPSDGIFYSYSLFDSLPTIRRKFPQIHLMNSKGAPPTFLSSTSHVAVFASKSEKSLNDRLSPVD